MVRAFALGAKDRRIDPSWDGPIELFLVPDVLESFRFFPLGKMIGIVRSRTSFILSS